jgi:hypothetical protein
MRASVRTIGRGQPAQGGFYAGVMFGMESARDELAEALARAISEATKS